MQHLVQLATTVGQSAVPIAMPRGTISPTDRLSSAIAAKDEGWSCAENAFQDTTKIHTILTLFERKCPSCQIKPIPSYSVCIRLGFLHRIVLFAISCKSMIPAQIRLQLFSPTEKPARRNAWAKTIRTSPSATDSAKACNRFDSTSLSFSLLFRNTFAQSSWTARFS